MTIRTKLSLLILAITALAFAFAATVYKTQSVRQHAVFAIEAGKLEALCDRVVSLISSPVETLAFDYTFWDEMVSFVRSKDPAWAAQNIDASLSTFKVNAAWVYDLDERLVYSASHPADEALATLPIPETAIRGLFARSPFCRFFARTEKVVMEIFGATIHPTADREHAGVPHGYFFVGKIWDREHLSVLGSLLSARVSVDTDLGVYEAGSDPVSGRIAFSRLLKGWNGLATAVLQVSGTSAVAANFRAASRLAFAAFAWFAGVILFVQVVFLGRWLIVPLTTILRALREENPGSVRGLAGRSDEFGALAGLIERSFEERALLRLEVNTRRKAEAELAASQDRFMKAFRSNPNPMVITKLATGEVLDANDAFVRAFGYAKEDILGRTTIELGMLDQAEHARIVRLLDSDGVIRDLDIIFRTRAGQAMPCLFFAERMDLGESKLLLAVLVDMSARKKAEEELKAKIGELERFNAMAVERELKMVELKDRIRELEELLRRRGREGS